MSSIFDGRANPSVPGTVVPGTRPKRPEEYQFKRDWYLDQVYNPDIHDVTEIWDKYVVPYEGEIIKDPKNRKRYIVTHVDEVYRSTLAPFDFITNDGTGDENYPLFPVHEYGMLPGELPLFIDYSVSPPIARITGIASAPNPAYAMLYLGNLINPDVEKPISATYVNQEMVDNRIMVSPITPKGWNIENEVIKATEKFSVTLPKEQLKNGVRCTLVYYDQENFPLPDYYPVMVQHCSHLRDHNLATRYVKSIELISPWFTNSLTPNTIYLDNNIVLTSVEFRAAVHYSDGTSVTETVNSYDGESGFVIHGLETFHPSVINQRGKITLTYNFKEHEQAYKAQPGQPYHMSQTYTIIGTKGEGANAPRLFEYPYWDKSSGWKLKHFVMDLTRKTIIDVTDKVKLNRVSPAFNGKLYGEVQGLIYNLTLSDVNKSMPNWTFTQNCYITLYNDGTSAYRKWDVKHNNDGSLFSNLEITYTPDTTNSQKAQFNGISTLADFLSKAYYATSPIIDPTREDKEIVPTHMRLMRENGTSVTVAVGTFNNLKLGDWTLINGETLFIAFIRQDGSGNELQLSLAAAITRKI